MLSYFSRNSDFANSLSLSVASTDGLENAMQLLDQTAVSEMPKF
jgi:hypothetical protein